MSALTEYLDNVDADAENARNADVPRLTAALREIDQAVDEYEDGGRTSHGAHEAVIETRRILDRIANPTVDDLVGADPGWTGDLTTDEYVTRQRDTGSEQGDR